MSQVRFPGDGTFIFQIAQNLFPYMAEPAVSLFFFFPNKGNFVTKKALLRSITRIPKVFHISKR